MLDERDIEAVAQRVVELLVDRPAAHDRLVDANELAAILGVEPLWVRHHADMLGAVRLGDGPKPRLRFDAASALARMRTPAPEPTAPTPAGPPQVRRRRARRTARR